MSPRTARRLDSLAAQLRHKCLCTQCCGGLLLCAGTSAVSSSGLKYVETEPAYAEHKREKFLGSLDLSLNLARAILDAQGPARRQTVYYYCCNPTAHNRHGGETGRHKALKMPGSQGVPVRVRSVAPRTFAKSSPRTLPQGKAIASVNLPWPVGTRVLH